MSQIFKNGLLCSVDFKRDLFINEYNLFFYK